MTEENRNNVPTSPEVEPPAVREELEQDLVTHQGHPVQASEDPSNTQGYLGTVETDVTPIRAPMEGPEHIISDEGKGNSEEEVSPHSEITPG